MSSFAGFSDRDFEAYAPQKWRSNVFNRERLEVKQKLVALGKALGAGLAAADGSPLTLDASVEHPTLWNHKQVDAQHVYFSRNEGARKELDGIIDRAKPMASLIEDPTPQRNHLFLVVTLAHERVEVALKLHPDARIDRQNLERKLADHFEREKLVGLLEGLGDGYHVGLTGGVMAAAVTLREAQLMEIVGQLGSAPKAFGPGAQSPLFYVGKNLPRAEVIAAGPSFFDETQRALRALLPIYHFVAWTRDNDFVLMREMLQKQKQVKRQRGLLRNDEVRIVRGMLAGKVGLIQEVDAKGGVKVLVGKLVAKLEADDVVKK